MKVSVIIPTYNERENVEVITKRITDVLSSAGLPVEAEVLFVDDSDDDTPSVLNRLVSNVANVRYLHRDSARGLGTAVVEGFHQTESELLIVMDADLQHPPELLPRIIRELFAGADIVIPSRFIPGGSDGGLKWFRKAVSWVARMIGRVAIGRLRPISDCTGGFFGLHRRVLEGADLRPVGWKILIEVLVKGRYQLVHEIPYVFIARDAGESKMSLREQWNYIVHIWNLLWTSPDDRRFYLFCLVGGLGTVVNLLVMSVLLYGLGWHGVFASVLASFVAMIHNFIWNDRLTWRGFAATDRWRRILQAPVFALVSGVSIVVTALLEQLFARLHGSEILGQFIGIAVATVWSFLANNRFTWRKKEQEPKRSPVVRVLPLL